MIKNKKRPLLAGIVCLLLLVLVTGIYLGTYYHASDEAIEIAANNKLEISIEGNEVLFFGPPDLLESSDYTSKTAFIFYPGGKVQYEAYAPLCKELADRGVLCALIKMPFNLAVFDSDKANDVADFLSERFGCDEIYIGGHSLGGAMAAYYTSNNPGRIKGLVLLAAYTSKDLSNSDIRVLSIYGTNDGVMSRKRYEKALTKLPENFTEILLKGGCHSYFGDYGYQKGDTEPTISREEQLSLTADAIADWLNYNEYVCCFRL